MNDRYDEDKYLPCRYILYYTAEEDAQNTARIASTCSSYSNSKDREDNKDPTLLSFN